MAIIKRCRFCGKDFVASAWHQFCGDVCRFKSHVDENGPVPTHRPELGHCHVWTGSTRTGYGRFSLGERPRNANVVALEWHLGRPLDPGMCALHKCDNKGCVRGDHLFEGTRLDNNADREEKGRGLYFHGEEHSRAKLTEANVREIRRRVAAGESKAALGREFGVHRMTISYAADGTNWGYLT